MNLFFVQQQPNEHDRSLIERLDMERQSTPLAMERAASAPAASTHTTKLDRFVIQSLFEYCGKPRIQIDLWDGTSFCEPESEPLAVVRLNNRTTLWKLISNVDIGFGDQFTEGNLEIEGDLVAVLCEIYTAKQRSIDDRSLVGKLFSKLTSKKARSNTLSSSKSNIHHHYDLGNEFYSLWLDSEAMQYTCAYFPYEAMSIEEAQIAKMDHVCKKLMLEPGQTVVEAGCGWGGLAVYMAKNYGVNVRSYNISHEQIVYAQNRAQELGLSDQVEYVEDDYRNIDGSFDAFVSVGMLEHVGLGNFAELGAVIDRCLKNQWNRTNSLNRSQYGRADEPMDRKENFSRSLPSNHSGNDEHHRTLQFLCSGYRKLTTPLCGDLATLAKSIRSKPTCRESNVR